MDSVVLEKWNELKSLVEALDNDVAKSSKGVAAAGVRSRKGLRLLKTKAGELVKLTIELEKKLRSEYVETSQSSYIKRNYRKAARP